METASQSNLTAPACSVPCDLCGSTDVADLARRDRDGSALRTVICRRCGLVYSDPRPAAEQVRAYYEHSYRTDYKATYQPKAKHTYRAGKVALDRYQRLAEFLTPGCRVLDFGAGGGEVVYMLRTMGYAATGFEPNAGYAKFAAEQLGLPVLNGFYQTVPIEPQSQDVVTAFHVVEHLESPCGAFQQVRQWLRASGRLVVEVPNVEAICQWPHSRFHRAHLYNFNLATLEMTGRKSGYRVISRATSFDGGNITVVFERDDAVAAVSGEIPGNCARVAAIVRGQTWLRHLGSPFPYLRPLRKIAARLDESRGIRNHPSPQQILDGLIAGELAQLKRRA